MARCQLNVEVLFTVFACAAVAGCSAAGLVGGGNENGVGTPASAAEDIHADADETRDGITATLATRAVYDELLSQQRGKVVLVDFWATWCPPCMEQFSHTVELSKSADPTQLAVISVSMDQPEDRQSVETFLQDAGAEFDHLISSYGIGQEGFEAFEITDGSIPHYKIYDRTGKLRHAAGSNENLEEILQQLLLEP